MRKADMVRNLYLRTAGTSVLALIGAITSGPLFAATYYIDFASGSDSNNGTSKTTPWKRAPGMAGCTASCASKTPQAGDRFIFKGGVTWDHTALGLSISWSGSSGNPIYFGVDETWYAGGSWKRPTFHGGHTNLASGGNLISIYQRSYITIDNIELKSHRAFSNWGPASVNLTCTTHVTLTRLYIHDWSLSPSVSSDDAHGGVFANNWAGCNPVGNVIDRSVLSNTEARDAGRQNGVAVRSVDVQYSVIHDVSTAQLFGRVHSSLLYNVSYPAKNRSFDSNYHTNVTYIRGWNGDANAATEPAYIYNNVIYNFGAGSGGIYPNVCGNASNATYIWNNVIYNNYSAGNSNIQIEPYGGSAGCGVFYIWNNTLHVPATTGSSAIRVVSRGYPVGTVVTKNNHYIANSAFSAPSGVNNRIDNNNITQTESQALSEGFTHTLTFAFSPIQATVATVRTGENLTGTCTGEAAKLCVDTSYAVRLDETNQSVIMPARTSVSRPAGDLWDVGAYRYMIADAVMPPTGLSASVQ